uniref:Ig-like domain-containing protein n=1 Tax=Neovison vison TaxID=452646 RepID=A0A8C7BMJ3_NEOVI
IIGFYCLLCPFWLCLHWTNNIRQSSSVHEEEGKSVTLDCSFTLNFNYYVMYWYHQPPNGKMTEVISMFSDSSSNMEGRYTLSLLKRSRILKLTITGLMPADTGVYFCWNTGNQKLYFGRGTSLTVVSNITDPDPAVYQLRSPKSSNISVCLFTDFDSETNEEQAPEPTMTRLKSTVLDMWSMNSKSNGALAWSASTDFKCNETFHEEFYSSSGENFSCNATLIEKNFETDMNLNFHNLFMIGLRVILLKVAGFNLLMTLQLWSR